ncbi:polysaccharide deacetylase family protein [Streptomyces tremellae]|uniref:polysaccharide deacetylase family protein n=1 Tax=Streptomyces tremellae TaxID=1124239 RepID=UPI0031E8FCBF
MDCRKAKCVALSFDAGPSRYTPAVLKALAKYPAHATFMTLGKNHVLKHPDLVRQEEGRGPERRGDRRTPVQQGAGRRQVPARGHGSGQGRPACPGRRWEVREPLLRSQARVLQCRCRVKRVLHGRVGLVPLARIRAPGRHGGAQPHPARPAPRNPRIRYAPATSAPARARRLSVRRTTGRPAGPAC